MSIKLPLIMILLGAGVLAPACDTDKTSLPPPGAESRAAWGSPTASAPAPAMAASTANEETAAEAATQVRALLLARHSEDLPTRVMLDAHPDAAQGLRWLALNDATMIVRARALLLLGLYADPPSELVVVAVVSDATAHRKLRAAAVSALAGWDLGTRADLRALAIDVLDSSDVAVAVAGARVLAGVRPARSELQAHLDQGELASSVATAVRTSLGLESE